MQWHLQRVSLSWNSGHLKGIIVTELNNLVQTKYILKFFKDTFFDIRLHILVKQPTLTSNGRKLLNYLIWAPIQRVQCSRLIL